MSIATMPKAGVRSMRQPDNSEIQGRFSQNFRIASDAHCGNLRNVHWLPQCYASRALTATARLATAIVIARVSGGQKNKENKEEVDPGASHAGTQLPGHRRARALLHRCRGTATV